MGVGVPRHAEQLGVASDGGQEVVVGGGGHGGGGRQDAQPGNDACDCDASRPEYHARLLRYIACVCVGPGRVPSPYPTSTPTMAAFTVKATYRSETRKLSFTDNTFPSYEQLYSQVSPCFRP